MIIKQVKISSQAKEKLSRLKAKTSIQNWNVLCRWAFCYSLSEPTIPAQQEIITDSNVEMTWQVFGGEFSDLYEMLVRERCILDGLGEDPEILQKYFKLHLHRGIAYLAGTNVIRSIDDLFTLATEKFEEWSLSND